MKARLTCPTCRRPLWVEIGTAGGHHTEAWPAHECRAVEAEASALAALPHPPCMGCGADMDGRPLQARYCRLCRHISQLQERFCEDGCGTSLTGRQRLVCEDCAQERKRAAWRAQAAKVRNRRQEARA